MEETHRAIKALCAYLRNVNGRQTWQDYGIREYLSVTDWFVREQVPEADDFVDYWIEHMKPGLPGRFQIRIELSSGRTLGVYWAQPGAILQSNEEREAYALLRDMTFTPFMADRLKRNTPIDHPDFGSW